MCQACVNMALGKSQADLQIWSIRFSADGKEVVAGAGRGKIMVYDIEAQTRSLSVSGHADDGEPASQLPGIRLSQSTRCLLPTSRPPISWFPAPMTATSRSGIAGPCRLQRHPVCLWVLRKESPTRRPRVMVGTWSSTRKTKLRGCTICER